MKLSIKRSSIRSLSHWFAGINWKYLVALPSIIISFTSIAYFYATDKIIAYGDAESHLDIAKRTIQSLTPGLAQLGGIWLPLPHAMMIPFIGSDFLWRSGLAGSIVSGTCFVISSVYLYKLTLFLSKSKPAAFLAFIVFATNPNVLYMQSTPMTELSLITFFLLSSYYFIRFLFEESQIIKLIMAAFFGFCATLTRYDGWFLVGIEAMVILLFYGYHKKTWKKAEGKFVLFGTLAFLGILLWIVWDGIILGDPFYFTNSQFSAKAQQEAWFVRGELPARHNVLMATAYYFVTSMSVSGVMLFLSALAGLIIFVRQNKDKKYFLALLVLAVPFIFNVFTLFVGQSVIFIPHLTPVGFEWRLFNVRYGLMFVPVIAFCFGYLFSRVSWGKRMFLIFLFLVQFLFYSIGYSKIVTLADATTGLSAAKRPDAEYWLSKNYDYGLVLLDDYSRTLSVIRSNIPMQNVIYIGNKPYWKESLQQPEKYARWIVMQQNDDVWRNIYDKPEAQGRLYAYFKKVYTSPQILIFKRNEN